MGFKKIDSVKESPEGIDCFKGNYWSLVKDDLKEMVDQYLKEKDFFLAIKKNDFAQISFLKDEGYIPSPEAINNLKGSAPVGTMIAVQKIFGLSSDAPGLSNIKLAQSNSKELGLNTEKKYLNTDFFPKSIITGSNKPATGVPMQEYIFPTGKCLHLSAGKVCSGYSFSDCSDQ